MAELKNTGHFISIVSTKYTKRIEAALHLDSLRPLTDTVVGGDQVEHPKPSPEGLDKSIDQSGICRGQTLYIGDSEADACAAKAAGVGFVAVLTGQTASEVWNRHQSVDVVDDLSGLKRTLQGIRAG